MRVAPAQEAGTYFVAAPARLDPALVGRGECVVVSGREVPAERRRSSFELPSCAAE